MKSFSRKPFSAHHHTNGLFQTRDVLERIRINQKKIGAFPLSNRAELFVFAQEYRRIDRHRANRFIWGETASVRSWSSR